MPTTRSFLLEKGGVKKFWDITWDGPSVEISSGKWGTNGRAREENFASPDERDAFIAAQIAKIRKQGYLEVGEIAPTPDFATPDHAKKAAAVRAKVDRLKRPAWLPIFGTGDGVGRVRAPMTMAPGEAWPTCPHCERALSGVLELDMTRLPATHLRREGVAQLFWCEAWEGERDSPCTVSNGWLARWHAAGGHRVAGPRTSTAPIAVVDWERIDELPRDTPSEMKAIFDDGDPSLVAELLRSVGVDEAEDSDAFNAYAKGLQLRAVNKHKLAGYPTFVQECSVPFEHQLFQIEMLPPFNMNLGDLGAAHLLIDRRGELRFFWACH
jgi:predicted DNA-binding WGR domain protein